MPKLGDFGLAISFHDERPVTRVGTLDFMAPGEAATAQRSGVTYDNTAVWEAHSGACAPALYLIIHISMLIIDNKTPRVPLSTPRPAEILLCHTKDRPEDFKDDPVATYTANVDCWATGERNIMSDQMELGRMNGTAARISRAL